MRMENECFLLRESHVEGPKEVLSLEKYREYLDYLVQLGLHGECYVKDPLIRALLRDVAVSINQTNKKYEHTKECGKKGGRPNLVTRAKIEAVIEAYGTVSIKDLADFFGVSARTINRYITRQEIIELADEYHGPSWNEIKIKLHNELPESPISMPATPSVPFE